MTSTHYLSCSRTWLVFRKHIKTELHREVRKRATYVVRRAIAPLSRFSGSSACAYMQLGIPQCRCRHGRSATISAIAAQCVFVTLKQSVCKTGILPAVRQLDKFSVSKHELNHQGSRATSATPGGLCLIPLTPPTARQSTLDYDVSQR